MLRNSLGWYKGFCMEGIIKYFTTKPKGVRKMNYKKAKNHDEAWELQETYENKPHGWIQWKGTGVCMDIHCECGELTHIDADFAYYVKCGKCGRIYFCNGHIELIEVTEQQEDFGIIISD